jgi:hypothetical protein
VCCSVDLFFSKKNSEEVVNRSVGGEGPLLVMMALELRLDSHNSNDEEVVVLFHF